MFQEFGLIQHNIGSAKAGDVFGRLTVLGTGVKPGTYRYYAVCSCECGTTKSIRMDGITAGVVVSCGCVQKERTSTHGMTSHPLYKTWSGMLERCQKPHSAAYHRYGGRGIKICQRWQSIENFIEDMYPTYKKGLQIDRINNDSDYEPGNCRWATPSENSDNRKTGRLITYNGKTQSLTRWAEELNMSVGTLWERLERWKWPVEKALTTPPLSAKERMAIARAIRWGNDLPQ